MLPDSIPANLIPQAIREFDHGRPHNFAESTKYDLVVNQRRYPPEELKRRHNLTHLALWMGNEPVVSDPV